MKYHVCLTTDEYYEVLTLIAIRRKQLAERRAKPRVRDVMMKWMWNKEKLLRSLAQKLEKTEGEAELPPLDFSAIKGMWTYDPEGDDFYWTGFDGSTKPRRKAERHG